MRVKALDVAIDVHRRGYRIVDGAIVVSMVLVPTLVVRKIWKVISR